MDSTKPRRILDPSAILGAAGISAPGRFKDHGRRKGPLELDIEIAGEKRRAVRALKGITKSLPLSAHYRRRVSIEPAQDSKRARKAAGVRGRKASKRFYQQFKRGGLTP
jgi:hypothetical protein